MHPCPAHPDAEAVGACTRCGRFYCRAEVVWLDLHAYCAECAVRPDFDWLGRHYRPLEGRTSGFAWFLGVLGLALLVVSAFLKAQPLAAVPMGLFGLAALVHLTGHRHARAAPLVACVPAAALFAVALQSPWAVVSAVPFLGLAVAAWNDVRTRLFFRVPVSRRELDAHYRREGSNPLAVTASRLALLSLVVPGLGLVTFVLAVFALARVAPKATPPVTGLSPALGAFFFSIFTSTLWAFYFLSRQGL